MEDELDYGKVQALQAAQSPEAQEQALAALGKVGDKYLLPHEGLDASKTLAEFDARAKRADTEIRKIYGPNTRGYNRYKARHANEQIARRKAIANAVTAEMKHGAQVAVKTDTENRIARLVETDTIDAAGVLANQAADGEVASEALNNGVEQTTGENEFATDRLKADRDARKAAAKTEGEKKAIDADYAQKKALLDTATAGTRAALGDIGIRELTQISMQEEVHARKRSEPLRKEFRNIFMQRYKVHRAMNQSHEIAYANALEAARQGAISYFSERIKTGQVGSVLYTLDELERIGDDDYKKSVTDKTPTGVYDPSAYGFCRKSDLFALRKSAEQMIKEARAEARYNEAISLANGNAVLKSLVYGAQTQIDALYDKGDAVTPEDAQVLNKNLHDIVANIDEMYAGNPKLVGNHVKHIKSYYRSAQARYMKTMNLASNCQNEADFKELLQKYNNATSEVSEIDVPEIDENGQLTGNTIKASVDTHKAYVITLNQARRAGFCKGAEWNTGARAHLEPQKRAHRIQAALNDFLVEKQGGQTGKSPAGRIALDVNADGTVSVGNTNSELGKTFFDDADKGWYDSDIKVHPAVIRDVVKALDGYCISSLVTPTDEQLREQLNIAFNTAQAKNDARMFGYNFLEALRQRTAARFDPVLNREIYGNDRAMYRYLEQRGMPIDPSLRKSVESGKLQPSFQFLRNSIMPRSEQMKRRIAEQDNGRLDADDYIGDAEEP
jgi:hypothetical protein